MKRFKKIMFLFVLPFFVLVIILGFVVSNAVRPLGNPDLRMTEMAIVDVRQKMSEADSMAISARMMSMKGVSSLSLNRQSSLAVINYYSDEVKSAALLASLKQGGFDVAPKVFAVDPNARQCPIPTSWLYKIATIFRF